MRLRKLEKKDIPGMLEWMHDDKINCYFKFDAASVNEDSALDFVEHSFDGNNRHYAIVDEADEYQGTVSLKNINYEDENAEYAISLKGTAQGKGIASWATKEILRIAFSELNLQKVYLNVLSENIHAINFYEKIGYVYVGESPKHVKIKGELKDLKWYEISKDYNQAPPKEYRMIEFQSHGDERGSLVAVEGKKDIPFEIKRMFYIYGTQKDDVRGMHANRKSKFVLINISGTSKVKIDTGKEQKVFILDKPYKGLYLSEMIWKEMYDFSNDSVLLVLSSEAYDSNEYVRNYEEFLREVDKSHG